MKRGNVLGLVIGTILVTGTTAATLAYAGGWCTPTNCYVWESVPPGWGSGGSGSGSYDNTQTYGQPDPQAVCEDLTANPEPNCNVNNPPPLIQNGCGSASVDVPDFLVSFTIPWPRHRMAESLQRLATNTMFAMEPRGRQKPGAMLILRMT